MRSPRRPWTALALLCASVLLSSTAYAAPGGSDGAGARWIFELEVRIQGGEPFRVMAWEGQAITVRSQRHDLSLAVIPLVTDRVSGELSLWIGEAIGRRADGLVTRLAAEIPAHLGFRQPLAHFPVDVEVVQVREPTRSEMMQEYATKLRESDILLRNGAGVVTSQGTCCVSCPGGDTLCGCCVIATCGSCGGGCCGAIAK